MRLKKTLWILLIVGIISCKQKSSETKNNLNVEPKVVNGDNELAFNEIKKLNLDSIYLNLLDPRNVTEAEYQKVGKSWTEFHKNVSDFIKSENFKWEVPDSTITVMNRIYFSKDGTVDFYTFKIRNQSVSTEKRTEYEKVLQKFCENVKIDLYRNERYAQCGKIKYVNY
ncbi:hypothetical protein VOI54_04525 [Tamlana sp. 2201CG12-4]|uniref:hypothetical protein n=1 Tax=Tamlana sp. 2201CG12-4 TaxID=3112582 RepID=UPI002DC022E9|nr:hypothetical protein [Tamlana sp. 2201CG12-4]MEC3906269.1 hypothetical protein [Tamlana sp. 2201CG12-4]